MKKIPKGPAAALPNPELEGDCQGQSQYCQGDGSQGWGASFWWPCRRRTRRSPKRRKQQLLMMIGREVGQNDQKCPSARRSSAALWRAPRILQPQGYSRVNSLTKSFSITPKASMCLLLEMPSSRFSRRILRFAPANLRLLGCLAPTCCGKNLGKPASFE